MSNMNAASVSMINKLISSSGGRKISNVRTICYNKVHATSTSTNDGIYSVTVDGGADTCLDGKGHIFLEYTPRVANVVGFDDEVTKTNLHIGTSVTVATLSSGSEILLLKNESIDHTSHNNSMLSVNQVRSHGVDVDDCPKNNSRLKGVLEGRA